SRCMLCTVISVLHVERYRIAYGDSCGFRRLSRQLAELSRVKSRIVIRQPSRETDGVSSASYTSYQVKEYNEAEIPSFCDILPVGAVAGRPKIHIEPNQYMRRQNDRMLPSD